MSTLKGHLEAHQMVAPLPERQVQSKKVLVIGPEWSDNVSERWENTAKQLGEAMGKLDKTQLFYLICRPDVDLLQDYQQQFDPPVFYGFASQCGGVSRSTGLVLPPPTLQKQKQNFFYRNVLDRFLLGREVSGDTPKVPGAITFITERECDGLLYPRVLHLIDVVVLINGGSWGNQITRGFMADEIIPNPPPVICFQGSGGSADRLLQLSVKNGYDNVKRVSYISEVLNYLM